MLIRSLKHRESLERNIAIVFPIAELLPFVLIFIAILNVHNNRKTHEKHSCT